MSVQFVSWVRLSTLIKHNLSNDIAKGQTSKLSGLPQKRLQM